MVAKMLDKIGICASSLCLIHCLTTPLVIVLFPGLLHSLNLTHEIHAIFAIVVITLALSAVLPHCRKHGHKDILAYALGGSGTLVLSLVFHHAIGDTLHLILSIAGSILLIIAHLKNIRVRHGKCTTETTCNH